MKIVQLAHGSRITEPGFYQMSAEDYFGDPCPSPSFNQSLAKLLLEQSCKHAWCEHPRLGKRGDESDDPYSKPRAIGNAAHSILIGRGKLIAVANFDDWRKKEAQEFRRASIKEGREPILAEHHEAATAMAKAARGMLCEAGWSDAFDETRGGFGEVVLAWQENGLWLRTMIDWFDTSTCLYDFKSTGGSASPLIVDSKMCDDGWDVQAAMQERGLDVLDPENAGRRKFRFALQENYEPYELTPVEIPESVMLIGRKQLSVATQRWRAALTTGKFVGYPRVPHVASYPPYAEKKWLEREAAMDDVDHFNDPVLGKPMPSRAPKVSTINAG